MAPATELERLKAEKLEAQLAAAQAAVKASKFDLTHGYTKGKAAKDAAADFKAQVDARPGADMTPGTDMQGGSGPSVIATLSDEDKAAGQAPYPVPWYQRRAYALPGSPTYGVLAGIAAALAVGGYVWHKRARR